MDVPVPVVIIVGLALVALLAIIVAPWRRVRSEPPLPDDVETRVLLGESPDEIDATTRPRPASTSDAFPPAAS